MALYGDGLATSLELETPPDSVRASEGRAVSVERQFSTLGWPLLFNAHVEPVMDDPIVIVTEHKREHLLTVQEFADLVRVHPLSIYRLIREGKQLGVFKVGRHIRINLAIALPKIPTHTSA